MVNFMITRFPLLGAFSLLLLGLACAGGELPPLTGTSWVLTEITSGETTQITNAEVPLTLEFLDGGSEFNGWTGCNSYYGTYDTDHAALRVPSVEITQRTCPTQELFHREQEYQRILSNATSFVLEGELLTIEGQNGGVLVFGLQSAAPTSRPVPTQGPATTHDMLPLTNTEYGRTVYLCPELVVEVQPTPTPIPRPNTQAVKILVSPGATLRPDQGEAPTPFKPPGGIYLQPQHPAADLFNRPAPIPLPRPTGKILNCTYDLNLEEAALSVRQQGGPRLAPHEVQHLRISHEFLQHQTLAKTGGLQHFLLACRQFAGDPRFLPSKERPELNDSNLADLLIPVGILLQYAELSEKVCRYYPISGPQLQFGLFQNPVPYPDQDIFELKPTG